MLAAVAVLITMSIAAPSPASAITWGGMTAQQQQSVVDWLRAGSPGSPYVNEGPADDATARRLWEAEKSRRITQATGAAQRARSGFFHQQFYRLRESAKLAPKWGLGRVSLLSGVGILGFQIGSGINARYFEFGLNHSPPVAGVTAVFVHPLEKGGGWPGDPTPADGHVPYDGFVYGITRGGQGDFLYTNINEDQSIENGQQCYFGDGNDYWQSVPEGFSVTDLAQGSACLKGFCPSGPCQGEPIWTEYDTENGYSPTPGIPLGPGLPIPDPIPSGPEYTQKGPVGLPAPRTDQQIKDDLGELLDNLELDDPMNGFLPWLEYWLNPLPQDPLEDPALATAILPDCRNFTVINCADALTQAGIENFQTVELDFDGADLDIAPSHVVELDPEEGSRVELDTPVEIRVNPPDDEMPRKVPAWLPAETGDEYTDRLIEIGLTPNPQILDGTTLNPNYGPNEVTGTSPAPETRVPQGSTVTIRINPPDAPPVTGGATCEPWVTPAIDLSPLADIEAGDVFPFAVPFWVFNALASWVGTPLTPSWDFHFPFAGNGDNWHVDLAMFDPHMPAIRAILLAASLLAMAWFFVSLAMGSPTARSGGSDD